MVVLQEVVDILRAEGYDVEVSSAEYQLEATDTAGIIAEMMTGLIWAGDHLGRKPRVFLNQDSGIFYYELAP